MQALKRTEKASHGQESLVSGSQKHVVGASSDSQTIETSSSSSETKEKHKISFLSRFSGCGVLLQQNKAIQQTPESQISTPGSLSSNELYTEQPEMPLGSLGKSERVDCSDIANRSSSARQSVKENWQWEQQRDFWKKAVLKRSVRYGPKHLLTADGLMNLGNSHLSCDESLEAGKSYLSALKVYQVIYGDYHLSVARALDKLGLAACKTGQNLDLALVALKDALKIRCELLGPDHVDAVDTLNNIAGVRLNLKQVELAALDYLAVFRYRERIFGRHHASVAVTSYTLACILNDRLAMKDDAREFFLISLCVYDALGLTSSPHAVSTRGRLTPGIFAQNRSQRKSMVQASLSDVLQAKLNQRRVNSHAIHSCKRRLGEF